MSAHVNLDLVMELARRFQTEGGRAVLVGGYARDEAMRRRGQDIDTKDFDLEVFGIEPERLVSILRYFGEVHSVGSAFAVWKLDNLDVAIPRRDSKTGPGHKGFEITCDPFMPVAEAARRRDLTINSISFDPLTDEFIDPFNGLSDLDQGVLRATDFELFGDDPLRVLRTAQFAGRLDFKVEPNTQHLCQTMPLAELPNERIGEEWRKLLVKSARPSAGLNAMRDLLVIEKLHPELQALIGCEQDPAWHPEGDVWVHTLLVMDAAARIARREQLAGEEFIVLMLAALCHDLGKPATSKFVDGRIRSHGHSEAGEEPTRRLLTKLVIHQDLIERVVKLVREHLWPALNFDKLKGEITAGNSAIKRLAMRLHPSSIDELLLLAEADKNGRIDVDTSFPEGPALRARAQDLAIVDNQPKPILQGRHLIDLGLRPGPEFGTILRAVFEAQLDDHIENLPQAVDMAKQIILSKPGGNV